MLASVYGPVRGTRFNSALCARALPQQAELARRAQAPPHERL